MQATRLAQFINAHRNTIFIIGHLFGLERYIEAERESDNVLFEISTPALISIHRLMMAIKSFVASRVVLGSDTPYGNNNLKTHIEQVKDLDISEIVTRSASANQASLFINE